MPLINLGDAYNTKKDSKVYQARSEDRANLASVSKEYGYEYWDGDRKYGYGGYHYIEGYWTETAKQIIEHYHLNNDSSVLDIGCGKGYLLYEIKKLLPQIKVAGLDISDYAIADSKEEIRPYLSVGVAQSLPYENSEFDLVLCLSVLHNLYLYDLKEALLEIKRVSKKDSWISLVSYTNEQEKANLINWGLTVECFFTPKEWEFLFDEWGYMQDYSFRIFT